MSDSSDVDALNSWANQLETERAQLKRDLEHSADETQVYKEQCGELQAQLVQLQAQLQAQCTELKVKNRRLTRRLNEQTAHPTSPAAASLSEVALLRQQLAGKDQVIAAQNEKYQALLNSMKQSLLAAMPEDAAETLRAWQNELALEGPPSEGDAHSSHNDPGPMTTFQQQIQRSDNGSKTLVAQGATKTPAERPARQSKSPSLRQEPKASVEATTGYSRALTSQRAEEPLRSRPGQAPAPISQEISARQEQLRAEKREEIQKSAGRSQKPNKVGGSNPPQKGEERADTTLPSAPKQNVAASSDRGQFAPAGFKIKEDLPPSPAPKPATTARERLRQAGYELMADRPSSSASKQNVAATTIRGQSSPAEIILKEDLPPSPAPKQNVTASNNRPQTAEFILKKDLPPSAIPKESAVPVSPPSLKGTQGSGSRELITQPDLGKITTQVTPPVTNPQIRGKSNDFAGKSRAPHNASLSKGSEHHPQKVQSVGFLFNTGEEEEEPYLKAPTRYVSSFPDLNVEAVPQKPDLQESTPQRPLTEEPNSQVSTEDTIDTTRDALSWASNTAAPESDEEQPVFSAYGSGKRKAKGRFMPRLRGGRAHRQDRVRGRGLGAPSPHSDITGYLRDGS